MRYRFDVVGGCVVDVIKSAGGWLYDRATAGWDVTVLIPRLDAALDAGKGQALRILGARTLDLASALAQWEQRPRPQTVAVSAEMFAHHALVHHGVLQALEDSRTEVTLWGAVPAELDSDVDVRQHHLSAAARVFKTQALMVAMSGQIEPVPTPGRSEVFRCGVAACPSVAADLSPAS